MVKLRQTSNVTELSPHQFTKQLNSKNETVKTKMARFVAEAECTNRRPLSYQCLYLPYQAARLTDDRIYTVTHDNLKKNKHKNTR